MNVRGAALTMMLLACGSEQAVDFTTAEPPEPASVRLFMNVGDVTAHVPLDEGRTHELEVRVYAANGRRLTGYDHHFEISIEVQPASLASVADVEGRPLVKTLISSAPAGEAGSIRIRVQHPHTGASRVFGPFDVLIH